MTIHQLNEGIRLLGRGTKRSHFVGPRDPSVVKKAEEALGLTLPPSYREFVTRLGAGGFGSTEFYGVVDDDFHNSAVPDAIWLTLTERRESNLPRNFVIIGSTGEGAYYCLKIDENRGPEAPVVLVEPGALPASAVAAEVVGEDFGAFFLEQIQEQEDR